MIDKVELKSCHEVIDTVNVVNIESIFCGKPTDPDILTVLMTNGKRLYCDEACPVDSLQEEPVSEFLNTESMIESYKQRLISQANGVKNSPLIDMCLASYKHGINETLDTLNLSNIQRTLKNWKEPVSEGLEEAADNALNKVLNNHEIVNVRSCLEMFRLGAKWQEDKDKQTLNEEGVVVLPEEEFERMKRSLIKLAGREKQMFEKAIDADVKVDAGGYPYIPQMELYDYDKDIPLAKEGDKYKVILIKED